MSSGHTLDDPAKKIELDHIWQNLEWCDYEIFVGIFTPALA